MKNAILFPLLAFWLLGIGIGSHLLMRFEHQPGGTGVSPQHWILDRKIPTDPQRSTLVMLAHPCCPCTRASLAELDKLMADCQGKVSAYVLFLAPRNNPPNWTGTALRRQAASIPGVRVLDDPDGAEAQRLGAMTSGDTLLYSPNGQLLFHGGLTGARGHEGNNSGLDAVVSLIQTGHSARHESLVFGCPLNMVQMQRMPERIKQCLPSLPL